MRNSLYSSHCLGILYFYIPLLIYLFIKVLYDKQKKVVSHRAKRASVIGVTVGLVLMISLVMLVSCQFRFGILVIGSESMTGEINKGDMIIYERYEDQLVIEGQVIVFEKNKIRSRSSARFLSNTGNGINLYVLYRS